MTFLGQRPDLRLPRVHAAPCGLVVQRGVGQVQGARAGLLRPGRVRKLVQEGRPGKYVFVEGAQAQQELTGRVMEDSYRQAYEAYQEMLAAGVAREVARAVLPVGLFSSMYATCDARS